MIICYEHFIIMLKRLADSKSLEEFNKMVVKLKKVQLEFEGNG